MSLRTKGDLYGCTIRREEQYGKFNSAGTSVYAGTADSVSNDDSVEYQDNPSETGLMPDGVTYTMHSYGFTLNARMTWTTLEEWLKLTLGDDLDFTPDMTSFSARFNVSPNESKLYLGCKVTNLTVKADGLGRLLMVTAKVLAKYATYNEATSTNLFKDPNGVQISFPSVDKPDGVPLHYCRNPYKAVPVSSYVPVPAKSWTLSFDRGLTREPGMIGSTTSCKVSASGIDSVPQPAKSTLVMTQAQSSIAWDKIKLEGQETESPDDVTGCIVVPIGTGPQQEVSIAKYHIEGGLTANSQTTYDETIAIVITSITEKTEGA